VDVLCFDIGSGGMRAVRFNEQLEALALHDVAWDLHRDAEGGATLSVHDIEGAFSELARALASGTAPAAVSIGCFMHSFLVLSSCCAPLTPVYTWMDTTEAEGMDSVRRKIGSSFHGRTGCHYHPMFPVFKLAAKPPGRGNRVGSPKAWLAWELTGSFVEDVGMASASGLLDVQSGKWDPEILGIAGMEFQDLPSVANPDAVVGTVSESGSARFGIPPGTTLVCGSGDGFLANVGSGCTTPRRMAVTLGTSGVARQMVYRPALNPSAGTFCYRANSESFLLGCASSNGGNVLDWARSTFGPMSSDVSGSDGIPIFLPWMNGERSLEWNPDLRESWHGRHERHSPADLSRAAAEGVLFNIAQYVETIERESGVVADDIVLSGNGFREPLLAPLLASLLGRDLLYPESAGLATLRGAAVYAWRALGHNAGPALEKGIEAATVVASARDSALLDRFGRFKELRAAGQTEGKEF
jgi:gluconokinase